MSEPTQSPTLRPTPGGAWRLAREQGELITLPSGNVARLRPVAVDALLATGRIPDLLSPIAAKSLWSETPPETIAGDGALAKGYVELINLVVPLAMLEPRVVDNPEGDGQIALDDLEFADKVAIFNVAVGGATTLRLFRQQQARNLATVSDRQDLQPTTELPG